MDFDGRFGQFPTDLITTRAAIIYLRSFFKILAFFLLLLFLSGSNFPCPEPLRRAPTTKIAFCALFMRKFERIFKKTHNVARRPHPPRFRYFLRARFFFSLRSSKARIYSFPCPTLPCAKNNFNSLIIPVVWLLAK